MLDTFSLEIPHGNVQPIENGQKRHLHVYVRMLILKLISSSAAYRISFSFVVAIDCGPLSNPVNGTVDTSSGTAFLNVANYTCNIGYAIIGSDTRTCEEDGIWNSSTPTCQRKFQCK